MRAWNDDEAGGLTRGVFARGCGLSLCGGEVGQSSWRAALRLVSSPGANEGLLSFYLRAKGRIGRRMSELGFDSLQIVRPPIILGERSDTRLLERLAAAVFKLLPACVFGKFGRLAAQVSPAR